MSRWTYWIPPAAAVQEEDSGPGEAVQPTVIKVCGLTKPRPRPLEMRLAASVIWSGRAAVCNYLAVQMRLQSVCPRSAAAFRLLSCRTLVPAIQSPHSPQPPDFYVSGIPPAPAGLEWWVHLLACARAGFEVHAQHLKCPPAQRQ